MLQSRLINFSLVFVMAAYLPLWICCVTHAAPAPDETRPAAKAEMACCSTTARSQVPDTPDQPKPDHDCTCADRASAAFVNKIAAVSFEPVQPLFDLLPGDFGKATAPSTPLTRTLRVLIDASPPNTGPLLDQFCLLTT